MMKVYSILKIDNSELYENRELRHYEYFLNYITAEQFKKMKNNTDTELIVIGTLDLRDRFYFEDYDFMAEDIIVVKADRLIDVFDSNYNQFNSFFRIFEEYKNIRTLGFIKVTDKEFIRICQPNGEV